MASLMRQNPEFDDEIACKQQISKRSSCVAITDIVKAAVSGRHMILPEKGKIFVTTIMEE